MTIRPALAAVATALALSLAAALPARADLVITGRAAQALHCSALLYMVSDQLYEARLIDHATYNAARNSAVRMLAYVPGTNDQKAQAMGQRFQKIFATRTLRQLLDEFNRTAPWCQKNFP